MNIFRILAISFFKFYYQTITVIFYAYIPIHFRNSGFTDPQSGLLFSLQSLMAIVTYLPSGVINDRLSVRAQILLGGAVFTVFASALSRATTYAHFVGLFILWGLSGTMLDNSTNVAYYKESTVAPNRLFFSFYGITNTLAYAAGGLLGARILGDNDFSAFFRAIFFMSLIIVPLAMLLPNTRASSVRLRDYLADIKRPETAVLALSLFLFTYHWGAELTYFTMFMKENVRMTTAEVSHIYLTVGLAMSAIIFPLGYFKDAHRLAPRHALYVAVLFSSASQLGFHAVGSFEAMFWNQIVHSVGDAFFIYYWFNIIPSLYTYERIGGASSFVNLFAVISVIAGSYASGLAVSKSGDNYTAFLISGLLGLAVLPLQYFFAGEAGGRAPAKTAGEGAGTAEKSGDAAAA